MQAPSESFKILLTGRWRPGRVSLHRVPGSRRLVPTVESAIDTAWELARARPAVRLFDGPMCRLESASPAGDFLDLTSSETSYKIFLGTNMANPHFAADFGGDVMANPLGVSALIQTADDQLLLGRRNQSVAYYPGRVHPFAGSVEPTDADVFSAVGRELHEELFLNPADFTALLCLGLVEDQMLLQPELIFVATVALTVAQVRRRLDPAEHDALYLVPAPVHDNDRAPDPALTPVAAASLLLWRQLTSA